MILDTTVLVDLQRELRRETPGAATELLERSPGEPLSITFVSWMEFTEGYGDEGREDCHLFLAPSSSSGLIWK